MDDLQTEHRAPTAAREGLTRWQGHGEAAPLLAEHRSAENPVGPVPLTVAETRENGFKTLRPRFTALREAVAADHPVTRANLDWI